MHSTNGIDKGGATNLRLAGQGSETQTVLQGSATGYFRVDRLNTTRWWIVSPLGNPLILRSMYHTSRVRHSRTLLLRRSAEQHW